MDLQKLKKFAQFDTSGWVAISALLLCGLSGILLAIPYDFVKAYQSVFELLLFNPAGTFVRNLHYWSAQLFFIATLLHIYDHLSKSTESNIKNDRIWLIICMMVMFLGYEMISGFILKADGAGLQARRIVASMLESVPFAGKMLSSSFAGTEDHWMIVYVQHIATGTIILFIGVYEHVKVIWPKKNTFFIVLLGLLVISLLFRAPLGLADSNQLKGPWFFVGIQEMLHWTSHPGWVVLIFALLLLIFYFLPGMRKSYNVAVKKFFLTGIILYLLGSMMVLLFRGENWQWRSIPDFSKSEEKLLIFEPVNFSPQKVAALLPDSLKMEGCLLCHSKMKGLSDSHNPSSTGCYACHKGNPFTVDKLLAHSDMVKIPGDFSNVKFTCGTLSCHSEIADRMMNSLMTTQNGIIGVDKFVFQETTSFNDTFHVKDLAHSAADTHLRNLCAGCHLGNEKRITGNAQWLRRGGGCNACHLNYNEQATASMDHMQTKNPATAEEIHPSIDIQVSNDRCMSCHSRSGRISLNFEGWNETELKPTEVIVSANTKILPDERVLQFVQSDIHHQKGMACIDCHGSYEIMGDGKRQVHKENAVNVQCVDCHPSGKPNSIKIGQLPDRESQMIAGLRKYDIKNSVVITLKGKLPLLNTTVDSLGQIFLNGKLNSKSQLSKPQSSVCSKGKAHNRLSCESCHTAWVPQCIGCHNSYEKGTSGFDLLTGKPTKSTWVEYAGKVFAELPVLGISEKGEGKIVTAMPGMILTIDCESFEKGRGKSFHRLFAPASAHTTQREGRSCKSCHNDPLAIGFGRGLLRFEISGNSGKWTFKPRFALSKDDSLPEDAWTGFLKEAKKPYATRDDLRPFSIKEQKRILLVGSCLTCHEEKSKVMELALLNFDRTLSQRNSLCIISSN